MLKKLQQHIRSGLLLGGMGLLVSSCVQYNPQPVDLNRDSAEWQKLSASLTRGKKKLTAAEMRHIGLLLNPQLNEARLGYARSSSVAEMAGLWEDPSISAELEHISPAHFYNRSLAPSLSIPVTGLPAIAKKVAEQYKEADYHTMQAKERDYLAELEVLRGKLLVAHEKLHTMQRRLKETTAESDKASQLLSMGEVSFGDAHVITRRRSAMLRDVQEAENAHLALHLELTKMLGLHPSCGNFELAEQLPSSVPSMVAAPTPEQMLQCPSLLAKLATYGAGEEELRMEIRKQYPQFSLSAKYAHDGGADKAGIGIGFNIPLWNRNREAVARATADRAIKHTETINQWRSLQTEAVALAERGKLAEKHCREEQSRLSALRTDAQRQEQLYRMGEVDLPAVAEVRHELFQRRMAYLECIQHLLEIRTRTQYLNPQFSQD